jgi:hypothetical protein
VTAGSAEVAGWKAGTAKAVITPQLPLWMAGYAGRTKPADGALHDLYVRVLALEDEQGQRAVILASDTLGMSRPIYDAVTARLQQARGLEPRQIMLNASHTHCGPVLQRALSGIYPLNEAQVRDVEAYSAQLTDTIVDTIGQALDALQPATVSHGLGSVDFAVNRRTNREPDVPALRAQNLLQGPVDHSVPVLAVHTADGQLLSLVFAYACHNTTLDFYQWCGDYAGFAQLMLEARHPGSTALFVMGCGADQNPLPRRQVELAEQYGTRLADAVDAVLNGERRPVSSRVQTGLELTPLQYAALPERSVLAAIAAEPAGYRQRWAASILERQDAGEPLPTEYAYPVQAWRLGDDLLWVALAGEVVVDYSLQFKGQFGWGTWVTGYANDVMAYIPSTRVLLEGGYEGQSSMMVYGLPTERWADDVQQRVTAAVERLVAAFLQ